MSTGHEVWQHKVHDQAKCSPISILYHNPFYQQQFVELSRVVKVKVVDGGREKFLSPDYLKFILDYTGLYQPSRTQSSTNSVNDNICMGRNRLVTEEA